jgi:hypothetical protein
LIVYFLGLATLKWHWISPNQSANKSSIYSESHSSDCGLQHETALLILDYLHVSIKSSDQSGIDDAGADVEKLPVILLDHLISEGEWRYHNVGSNDVSLNNHLYVFHPGFGSLKTCLSPLVDSALGAVGRHCLEKNLHTNIPKKIIPKKIIFC